MKLDRFLQKMISWLFAGLFFLVPLFFTSVNSELFEFNKIILVYGFTTLIVGIWLSRILLHKRILFKRTFLDIPLVLFLTSQFLSTLLSIDPHTSLFGYYSRFNGGLLSAISYLLLYWAFVSNCEIKDVYRSIKASLVSAVIIAVYGIFEHFGHSFSCLFFLGKFDVSCWVQKVQERVFATLGQPNWLAAYLVVLTPLTWWLALSSKCKVQSPVPSGTGQSSKLQLKAKSFGSYILSGLLFLCLLFTQSRSGFLGFLLSFVVFWGITFALNRHQAKTILKPFLLFAISYLLLTVVFGSPFPQINKLLTANSFRQAAISDKPSAISLSTDGGISESGDIRQIVWKGAVDIFKHYPLFGSGVETFAYSYYNFRPMEHNLVSEWDFLYNKAHNEYLNYLSTTGLFGLGSYLFFITAFVFLNIKELKAENGERKTKAKNFNTDNSRLLTYSSDYSLFAISFSLLCGWLSLLVTNFFGFSVVVTSLYFFLIPAFITTINFQLPTSNFSPPTSQTRPASHFSLPLLIPLFAIFYLLFAVVNLWRADFFYNRGLKFTKSDQYSLAFENFDKAININSKEPVFLSEISASAANLALQASEQKDEESARQFLKLAVAYSKSSRQISPKNLNLIKTQISVLYTLSLFKPEYLQKTIDTVEEAIKLAPTDPKLIYKLGLLFGKAGQGELAVKTIEKSVEMKPNYVDGRNALSIFYEDRGEKQKALEQLEILLKLAPENKETFEKRIDNLTKR